MLSNHKVTLDFLKSHLWKAADILHGSLDASEYRQPVMTILFLKRLNDRFEENVENLIKQGKSEKEAKITGCPICGCVLKHVYYDGVHPQVPPERYFEGLVDYDHRWHLVETQKKEWTKLEKYEYALTMDLYRANKGVDLGL